MDFRSINPLANVADKALITCLKLFGTNNVHEVIKLYELKDAAQGDAVTLNNYLA
jgi:hypothetical protein